MKILIIEDEYPAVERLQKQLAKVDEKVEVVGTLDSVSAAIAWLQNNPAPDVILSDIQLSDGLSFEIFDQVATLSPIIFTTSYDEYAIKAFKVKSIDYLLKPIKLEELQKAIQKYKWWKQEFSAAENSLKMEALLDNLMYAGKKYKKRFLIKSGEQLLPVTEEEIAYFYTERELVYVFNPQGKKIVMDYTLEQLEKLLDPRVFFRINRQFILSVSAIQKIHTYFNSRLKLQLTPAFEKEVIVSRNRVPAFKEWIEG